jgi:hypothetical protein
MLLDTHTWLWWLHSPEKISAPAHDALTIGELLVIKKYLTILTLRRFGKKLRFSQTNSPMPNRCERLKAQFPLSLKSPLTHTSDARS